jgi:hypothetical protein
MIAANQWVTTVNSFEELCPFSGVYTGYSL